MARTEEQTSELGFSVSYKVNQITSIKPTASGDFNGVKYDASVKFRSTNVITVEDPEFGLKDVETNIEFSIPCDDKDLRRLNNHLRSLSKEHKPIIIHGNIPTRNDNKSIYSVKSMQTGREVMTTADVPETPAKK